MDKRRCSWVLDDPLYIRYHDMEWGRAVFDDLKLFEYLVLDSLQAGLSWKIILDKREDLRKAFDFFTPGKIVQYDEAKVELLMGDRGIIRNRLKIEATITNAKVFFEVVGEYGSFNKYIWSFVGGRPIINSWRDLESIPTKTKESIKMSNDMKKRGFRFVGPTCCYAFMQAVGLVFDHTTDCFLYDELQGRI